MINSVFGGNRLVLSKHQRTASRTQESNSDKPINQEDLKCLDFSAAKASVTGGRRYFSDAIDDIPCILELSFKKSQEEQNTTQHHGFAAMLDLSQDAREKFSNMALDAKELGAENDGRPPDETGRLTRMLVAARSSLEVQSVLADAFNHMREWQKLAAEGDKKAIAVVRKLNRLVSRGHRKVRDLNKEQLLLQRQQKAEKAEQEQIAQRLRTELEQAERMRKQRERRYLQDRDDYNEEDEPTEFGPSTAATEAKIRALAAAMAALSSNQANIGDSGLGDSTTMLDGGIADSDISGAEVSEDI